jgi:hypothetical protein
MANSDNGQNAIEGHVLEGIMSTELLLRELRTLVSYGASAHRLAPLLHLRKALGVNPDVSFRAAGRTMRRALLRQIRSLTGSYILCGQLVAARQVVLALQVLFLYDLANAKDNDASTRRVAAMRHLGIHKSVDTWRKEPEQELLAILAEYLGGGEALTA